MESFFQKRNVLKSLLLTISLLSIFALSSCKKDEKDTNTDAYYVKYVISSMYPRIFSNWSVSTPDGRYTKNGYQTRGWEQTYGPVKKGFKCEVLVNNGEPTIEIYVSKNQEPLALKATTTANSASYTINF